jgi:hypothetical protein
MRVLLANLKLFYQCRALWLIYFLVASSLFWTCFFRGSRDDAAVISFTWMGTICGISLAVGAMVAIVQMGVIAAPLSFCLPEHRIVLRKLVLLVGLVLCLLVLSLEFAKAPPTSLSPAFLSGVSLTAYFAGVSIGPMFRYGSMGGILGAIFLPMVGTLLDLERSRVFVATTASGIAAILLGVVSAVAVWLWLGRTDLFRRRCGRPWLDASLWWDPAAREKYRWMVASSRERPVSGGRADRLLLGIVTRCRNGNVAKYVWGRLYTWLLPGAGGRPCLGFVSLYGLGSVALAWHMWGDPLFIAFAALFAGEIPGHSPLHSSMLVAGGRRERFWATMASILILGAILTLSVILAFETVVVVVGAHVFAEPLRAGHPELLTDRQMPLNLRFIFLLLALFPIGRFLEVRLCRSRGWMVFAQTALMAPLIWLIVFQRAWSLAIPVECVAPAFVLSWVLCTYGVYRIAMRSDLGRK